MLLLTSESSLRAAAEAHRRVLFKGKKGYLNPFPAGLQILLESMLKIDPESRHAPKVLIQNPWFDDLHGET
jgi:hypothetical protein